MMSDSTQTYLTTAEVARLLHLNEKKIYVLASQGKIPSVRISGKWLFPLDLLERYLREKTFYPSEGVMDQLLPELFVIEGSDDFLFKELIFSAGKASGYPVAFGVLGSSGGLKLLLDHRIHAATVHFVVEKNRGDEGGGDAGHYLISLFKRHQGFMASKRKTFRVDSCAGIIERKLRIAVREKSCGTYHLTRQLFAEKGVELDDYPRKAGPYLTHLEAGQAVVSGEADVAVGIQRIAGLFDLRFKQVRTEDFYLMVPAKMLAEKLFMKLLDVFFDGLRKLPPAFTAGYEFGTTGTIRPYVAGDGRAGKKNKNGR